MSRYTAIYGTKGGVGKSTIAVNTAYALCALGAKVGLLDLDLYGPNVHNLVSGIDGKPPTMAGFRVVPGSYAGVDIAGLGFFVRPHEAGLLTGKYLEGALEQLVFHDAWDSYDHVVLDLPPGFTDLHRLVFTRLSVRVALVTTPHVLSTQDLARGVRLLEQIHTPTHGLIENMSHISCEHCGLPSRLFTSSNRAEFGNIPLLASIPFVPEPSTADGHAMPLVLVDEPAFHEFRTGIRSIATSIACGA